jgi:endonuclease-3
MSAKNRADLINKLYKYVKKNYTVIPTPSNRTVLDHMLYGCCLENSTTDAADEAFAKLQENFFDWNEVRVTTVAELAEVAKGLSVPTESATSLKKTLHGVFETFYQFDLDFLRKENLSKSVQSFEKFKGVSPFVVSYVAQNGLGGHSIPLDRSMLLLFQVLGIMTEDEVAKGRVPGLERTIPKAKGIEFFSLTHQLAVEFSSGPFRPTVREKLLKIAPDAKERFPKRGAKKKAEAAKAAAEAAKAEAEKAEAARIELEAKEAKLAAAAAKATKKTKPTKKTKATKPVKKKVAKKPTKPTKTAKATKKKVAKKATKKKPTKKVTKKKASKKASGKKSPTKRLSKKKPR